MTIPPTFFSTEISSVTTPISPTATHKPTKTLEPTATPQPTATPTPKPTATPTPDVSMAFTQALTETGISLPAELAASFLSSSTGLSGSFSISNELAKRAGFSQFRVDSGRLENAFTQTYGFLVYASLGNDQRYDSFYALVPPEDDPFALGHSFVIAQEAEKLLPQLGGFLHLTLSSDFSDYAKTIGQNTVDIRNIQLNFLTKDEFTRLADSLLRAGVPFALSHPDEWHKTLLSRGFDSRILFYINGDSLHVYGYTLGWTPYEETPHKEDYLEMEMLGPEVTDGRRLAAIADAWSHYFNTKLAYAFMSPTHPYIQTLFHKNGDVAALLCTDKIDQAETIKSAHKNNCAELIFR